MVGGAAGYREGGMGLVPVPRLHGAGGGHSLPLRQDVRLQGEQSRITGQRSMIRGDITSLLLSFS